MQSYKYPPRELYFTYGIMCSLLLYEGIKRTIYFKEDGIFCKCLSWLSKNSFMIYFAHVFLVYFFEYGKVYEDRWLLQYLILIVGSTFITLCCNWIKKKLLRKGI